LICTRCHSISDLDIDLLQPVKLQGKLPSGFRLEKFNVEVQGVCKSCAASAAGGDYAQRKARMG
jgi:Fe2+ or Zn2+ uptake regulation protein